MLQIKTALHELVEAILQTTGKKSLDADLTKKVYALTEVIGAQLQAMEPLHQVEVLRLQAGDVLVLKMGDPAMGWIPTEADSVRIAQAYREALDNAGHTDDKVQLVWSHYGCQPVIVRSAKDVP